MERLNRTGLALNEATFEPMINAPPVVATPVSSSTAFQQESDADAAGQQEKYDLVKALIIIRKMETSSARTAVFEEIKKKNRIIGLANAIYTVAGARLLQPLVLFAYMLKSILSVGPIEHGDHKAVAISNFQNEHKAISRLLALLPEMSVMQLSLKNAHAFKRGQIRAAFSLIFASVRLIPFLSRLARTYSFMPSARIANGLAFYLYFSRLFAQHSHLRAAIVASNYSPESLGLAAAAHMMERKVVYANHAPVPANGASIPPVLADCAIFYGDAVRRTYENASRCRADVTLIGQPGTTRPMEWCDQVEQIGIFLTALTSYEAVEKLVLAIKESDPSVQILIRNHPVTLLKCDFSGLSARHDNVTVTVGTPLEDEIEACDLVLCGNSGVAMNVLRGGRPVAYIDALDELNHDYCGFVQDRLVCEVKEWGENLYPMLKAFYTGPAWRNVMQSYDASYNCDISELEQNAAQKIQRYVS